MFKIHIIDLFLISCSILAFLMVETFLGFGSAGVVMAMISLWPSVAPSLMALAIQCLLTFVGLFLLLIIITIMIGIGQAAVGRIKEQIDEASRW